MLLIAVASLFASTSFAHAGDWALPMQSPQVGGITTFASRTDGTFFTCEVDGNDPFDAWMATSHGLPGGGGVGQVSAHYHRTNTDLYAFTRTTSGNLYLRYAPLVFNDPTPSWSWHNLGKPSTASIAGDPSSASYGGFEWAFVVGSDQHLYGVRGAPWVWSDHGTPAAGVGLVGRPSTIVYADSLYTFVVGTDGQLYLRTWNGIAWSWVAAGAPSGTLLEGSPSAATRTNTIDVFVGGADDHLYTRQWTGSLWQWLDQGSAANGIGAMDVAWFGGVNGQHDLYSFGLRYTNAQPGIPKLLESHWDSSAGWELQSHNSPPQSLLFRQPSIAGAFAGPIDTWPTWRVNVFVHASSNRIYRRIWAQVRGVWQWAWSTAYCQM